jgi:hypothetical protein
LSEIFLHLGFAGTPSGWGGIGAAQFDCPEMTLSESETRPENAVEGRLSPGHRSRSSRRSWMCGGIAEP